MYCSKSSPLQFKMRLCALYPNSVYPTNLIVSKQPHHLRKCQAILKKVKLCKMHCVAKIKRYSSCVTKVLECEIFGTIFLKLRQQLYTLHQSVTKSLGHPVTIVASRLESFLSKKMLHLLVLFTVLQHPLISEELPFTKKLIVAPETNGHRSL